MPHNKTRSRFPRTCLAAFAALHLLAASCLLEAKPLKPAPPQSLGISSERLERLDNTFSEMVESGQLPGAVVLVARHGKRAHLGIYGERDQEADAPMKRDTIFRIASQTKAIVSVGAMILQEEGKLLINDPVSKYLPEFAKTTVAETNESGETVIVPAKRPITIRDLLTHTSGIGYNGKGPAWEASGIGGWYFADREEPIRETVRRMAELPFAAHPGERYVYGYNTDILGAVLEVASGKSLDVFLREKILDPLEMNDTHFYLPQQKADRLSVVYSYKQDRGLERAPDAGGMSGQGQYLDGPRQSFSGGAGLLSTADDYAIFLQMLLDGGEYNGVRILSRKSVELMTCNHLAEGVKFPWKDGAGFGLGFRVVEDLGRFGEPGSVGEFSWGGAYHSTYWVDPAEDLLVVYFTQVRPAGGLDDHAKLRALVYQAIVD
ncbi:serine hydrolase domain-containing protein [Pelagicoccus sp. SDUM812005]|uniref:serine hydrolase domain-containing protein n=1 Tax=Pelagicoccus sp. SDUM812005 TaxID=3041257 RepID=UPI00280F8A7F|nr:serine hydrolase domain-containing protein [Pelagicoccus sp. SDUM812005]MDQ8179605.1 serine hydrolase [Pelagicoccus sp. SDUM812005]